MATTRNSLQKKEPEMKITEKTHVLAIKKAVADATQELTLKYRSEMQDIGTKKFTCGLCGALKSRDGYYKTTDPRSKIKISRICKQCSDVIVYQIDEFKNRQSPTEESIKEALMYLNKPWIQSVFDSSIQESANVNSGKTKSNVWTSYIKNISMPQWAGLTWKDSEFADDNQDVEMEFDTRRIETKEVIDLYQANKKNVIYALGYDPFESVPEANKPLMYSKLSGMLDESTTEDEVKLGACIEIVHSFNQAERMNYVINKLQSTPQSIIDNAPTIKAMEATKKDIFATALVLAKDNGITIKHSNNNTKGANTWTGTVKKMKEMDLREAELNSFEIGTAEGMRQVAEISNQSIINQLRLDENDYTEMLLQQREMITNLQNSLEDKEEELRIYKRESQDLKQYGINVGFLNEKGEVI